MPSGVSGFEEAERLPGKGRPLGCFTTLWATPTPGAARAGWSYCVRGSYAAPINDDDGGGL
jgi:hypothetical protein